MKNEILSLINTSRDIIWAMISVSHSVDNGLKYETANNMYYKLSRTLDDIIAELSDKVHTMQD